MVIDYMGHPYDPKTVRQTSVAELTEFITNYETQRRKDVAREIAGVIAEINTTDLCEAIKGYFEAHLMLVASMVGEECLDELKRRLRE